MTQAGREEISDARGRRVALFGSYAPSLINFRAPLIAALRERGYHVLALAPAIDAATARALSELGAEPIEVSLSRGSLNPLSALRTLRDLKAKLRALKVEVLIPYTITPIVLAGRVARAAGIRRFVPMVTGLGYAFTGGREPKRLLSHLLAKRLYRQALRRADVAIFQNEDDRAEFRRLGVIPSGLDVPIVAGSGVDTEHFTPTPLPERPSFLLIARFLKDKGIREYGRAAARLRELRPEVEVRLAGWRDSSPDALTQEELDHVSAAGVIQIGRLDDVRPAIADCSIYVLPSYREGTPRSVLEAMAMGRAIITTNAPGCRQLVEPGMNGLLVEPRDADSLFDAMLRLADDPDLVRRMGSHSRQIAEERHDARRVAREFLDLAGL